MTSFSVMDKKKSCEYHIDANFFCAKAEYIIKKS